MLSMLARSASRTTWGPEMATSRFRLAELLSAEPTPTASMRLLVTPVLIWLASSTARSMVTWAASLRSVWTATSGGGPALKGSPGWLKSKAVGSPSVTKTVSSEGPWSAWSRPWSQLVYWLRLLLRR